MIAEIKSNNSSFKVDLSRPLDISIPLRAGINNVNAFHIPPVIMEPFREGSFIGDVRHGGSCNVYNIFFNPHGNGTHTETVGHISKEFYPIYKHVTTFFFEALLISVEPEKVGADSIITKTQLETILKGRTPEALIIRTLPNSQKKMNAQYSGTNPAYLEFSAAEFIKSSAIRHLLLDLPSIDKENDEGKLLSHHAFWNYPADPRLDCTITELAFIDDSIADGNYLLNLQIVSFDNDACPSKPVLYKIL